MLLDRRKWFRGLNSMLPTGIAVITPSDLQNRLCHHTVRANTTKLPDIHFLLLFMRDSESASFQYTTLFENYLFHHMFCISVKKKCAFLWSVCQPCQARVVTWVWWQFVKKTIACSICRADLVACIQQPLLSTLRAWSQAGESPWKVNKQSAMYRYVDVLSWSKGTADNRYTTVRKVEKLGIINCWEWLCYKM